MTVEFSSRDRTSRPLNGGPHLQVPPRPSRSFVNCETQQEVDELLGEAHRGRRERQCGWLKDKYGLSWQIVPTTLDEMMPGRSREIQPRHAGDDADEEARHRGPEESREEGAGMPRVILAGSIRQRANGLGVVEVAGETARAAIVRSKPRIRCCAAGSSTSKVRCGATSNCFSAGNAVTLDAPVGPMTSSTSSPPFREDRT